MIGQFHPGAERAVLRVELQLQVGRRPAFDVQGEATIRGNGPVRKECGDVAAGRGPLARRPVAVAERDALDRTGARVREAPHVETGCVAPVRIQADDHLRVVDLRGHECRRVPALLGGHRVVGTGVGGEAERVSIGARDDVTCTGAAGEPRTRHRRRAGVERPDPEQEERVERSPTILSVQGTGEGVCRALDCVEELRFDRGVPVRDQLVEGPRLPPGDALGVGRHAIVEYLGKAVERMGRRPRFAPCERDAEVTEGQLSDVPGIEVERAARLGPGGGRLRSELEVFRSAVGHVRARLTRGCPLNRLLRRDSTPAGHRHATLRHRPVGRRGRSRAARASRRVPG